MSLAVLLRDGGVSQCGGLEPLGPGVTEQGLHGFGCTCGQWTAPSTILLSHAGDVVAHELTTAIKHSESQRDWAIIGPHPCTLTILRRRCARSRGGQRTCTSRTTRRQTP
eukprot:1390313-Rhodomonas_salina.2